MNKLNPLECPIEIFKYEFEVPPEHLYSTMAAQYVAYRIDSARDEIMKELIAKGMFIVQEYVPAQAGSKNNRYSVYIKVVNPMPL